jgi:hypothetical protein
LKTQDAIADLVEKPVVIKPSLEEFDAVIEAASESVLV